MTSTKGEVVIASRAKLVSSTFWEALHMERFNTSYEFAFSEPRCLPERNTAKLQDVIEAYGKPAVAHLDQAHVHVYSSSQA